MSHTEELKAFLVIMSEVQDSSTTGAVLKLLGAWEKRTSEHEKKEAFSSIGKNGWRTNDSEFRGWVLDQKMLHPTEVAVSVSQIGDACDWSDTTDIPNGLRRLAYVAAHSKNDRQALELIDHMDERFLTSVFKTQSNIDLFQKFVDTILTTRPHLQSSCISLLPVSMVKKMNFSEDTKQEYTRQEDVKRHLRASHSDWDKFKRNVVPALEKINPNKISEVLNDDICDVVSSLTFQQYCCVEQALVSKGWDATRVRKWARLLTKDDVEEGGNGWILHWAKYNKKELMGILAEITSEVMVARMFAFGGNLKHYSSLIKVMNDAGISIEELNTYMVKNPKHSQANFYDFIEVWCDTHPTLLKKKLNSQKDQTLMKQARNVLPEVVVETMEALAYLEGYNTHLPTQLLKLTPLSVQGWEYHLHADTMAPRAFDLQQKYIALHQKHTIEKNITGPAGSASKRKM